MKSKLFTHKPVILVQTLLLFVTLWVVWYSNYYYTLYWLEGFSFFSTLPDFTSLQLDFPADTFKYLGAYFLQFFRNPLCGAAIQAGVVTLVVVGLELFLFRLLGHIRLAWLAFIPVPWMVAGQYGDITLERSMEWMAVVWGLVLLSCVPMKKLLKLPIPQWLQSPWLALVIPLFVLGVSVYTLVGKGKDNAYQEGLCRIDYHANRREWKEVLQLVPPKEAQRDEFKLRYALLALSETGQLADYVFKYGIKDYSQFLFYGSEDPFDRNFNALFYRALDMPNEVVHQTYQQSLTSPLGFNFRCLRMLVDTYLDMGNPVLAEKYMEVLRHSSFHDSWIEERLPKLEALKDGNGKNVSKEDSPFVGDFLEVMTSLVGRHPTNEKYVDLWLCSILTTRNPAYFYQAFQFVAPDLYSKGKPIPPCYEEALLMIAMRDSSVLKQFNISKECKQRFTDFMNLVQNGKVNAAKAKYPGSYWSYVF